MIPLAIILTSITIGIITRDVIKSNKSIDKMKSTKGMTTPEIDERIEAYITNIASVRGFTIDELRSKSRKRELVIVRQLAAYLTYHEFMAECLTYGKLGRFINRDHSTVIYSIRCIEDAIKFKDFDIINLLNDVNNHFESKLAA